MKDRSLPARVVGTHSLFLSANTQKDAASGGYLSDAAGDRTPRPGLCCGGTSPPLVEQRCIRRVSGGCRGGSHAEFAAGGGVLRLWSRVASGGYHADAVADRMLSLLRENEPSACMRTGVSEDNSRKSSGHFSRYCKALTLRSSAIWILVYFCLLSSSLKIRGGGEGEAAHESQVSSLRVDLQNQTTRTSQVRSHSGADLTPKLLRYRTKNKNKMSADRHFGLALDASPSSKYALKWAIDNVFKEGDHLILVVVHREVLEGGQVHLWGKSGSRKSHDELSILSPNARFYLFIYSFFLSGRSFSSDLLLYY